MAVKKNPNERLRASHPDDRMIIDLRQLSLFGSLHIVGVNPTKVMDDTQLALAKARVKIRKGKRNAD